MKRLLEKSNGNMDYFHDALLVWRNTPKDDLPSPAQLMFGYNQNFGQGAHTKKKFIDRREANQLKTKHETIKHHTYNTRSKSLTPLPAGTTVDIPNPNTNKWTATATILEKRPDGHSYLISNDEGTTIRNRRDLRPRAMNA